MDFPGPRASLPAWITSPIVIFPRGRIRALHTIGARASHVVAAQQITEEQSIQERSDTSLFGCLDVIGRLHEPNRRTPVAARAQAVSRAAGNAVDNLVIPRVNRGSGNVKPRGYPTSMLYVTDRER
jgi:hypothetical protein